MKKNWRKRAVVGAVLLFVCAAVYMNWRYAGSLEEALIQYALESDETGLFLETAHPAKFKGTVDRILDADIEIPAKLQSFMKGTKQSVELSKDFKAFKAYLITQ